MYHKPLSACHGPAMLDPLRSSDLTIVKKNVRIQEWQTNPVDWQKAGRYWTLEVTVGELAERDTSSKEKGDQNRIGVPLYSAL